MDLTSRKCMKNGKSFENDEHDAKEKMKYLHARVSFMLRIIPTNIAKQGENKDEVNSHV